MDKKIKLEDRERLDLEAESPQERWEPQRAQEGLEICDCQSAEPSEAGRTASENGEYETEISCQCSHRTKERSPKEYKDLLNRLNRIEGQVRGIRGMLERDVYCADILVQVSAVNAALNSFNKVLLSNHIHTCVAEDIRKGNDAAIDELTDLLKKLMK